MSGALTVVGTGIRLVVQLTPEARTALETADEVVYVVHDPVMARWLDELRPDARSLATHYAPGKHRRRTYDEMTDEILRSVRAGKHVCAAFYGHPGILVRPARAALAQARAEGYPARMLPGVSSFDCLVADLGIELGFGCQSYEATDFLVHRRVPDPTALLVLWQAGFVGDNHYPEPGGSRLELLVEHLERYYPPAHEVIAYEASPYAICGPTVERMPLRELVRERVPVAATLVVPAAAVPVQDRELMASLSL